MAVKWWYPLRNLQNQVLFYSSSQTADNPLRAKFSVTLYSGVQPSAATITSSWTSYNSNFLVHVLNVFAQCPYLFNPAQPAGFAFYSSDSATAINSGTATWAIMWPSNPNQAAIQGGTIPSSAFIVVPVTDATSNGAIRLVSTNIVSGNSYQINDVNIIFGGGIT